MSDTKPVNITILDKEYLIACHDEERDVLSDAAHLLSDKMKEIKDSGNVIGSERVAVLAALNIANEMLTRKKDNKHYVANVDNVVQRLQDKIDNALTKED